MRKTKGALGLGALVLALVGLNAGPALAATQATHTTSMTQWQRAITHASKPGVGCFDASYPEVQWRAVRCAVAPKVPPLAPVPPTLAKGGPTPSKGAPRTMVVGNGTDYSAQVSGLISAATGSFNDVSSGITEKGKIAGQGTQVANAFSLQLNTQFFSNSPACNGAAVTTDCLAWQQFVYDYYGGTGEIFMQYWLLNYNTACPSGWFTYTLNSSIYCYVNSNVLPVSQLKASDLATVRLTGTAASGGLDSISMSVASGKASLVTNSDSVVDLAQYWNTTEWDVFGDGSGGQANFGTDSTLEAQTALALTTPSAAAPTCVSEGFTAETNNLNFTATPAPGPEPSPTLLSEQTNGVTSTPSCQAAAASPSVTALSLSATKATYGNEHSLKFAATVSPDLPADPTGTVTVSSGSVKLCTMTLSSGTSQCSPKATALGAGVHSVVATYSGDTNFAGSASSPQSVTVTKASTTSALRLSTTSVVHGAEQNEHFTVDVAPEFAGTPTGTVSVKSGTLVLCKVTLAAGTGTCSPAASALAVGKHTITAAYAGNHNFRSSTSPGQVLTVKT